MTITDPKTEAYLQQLVPPRTPLLERLEREAAQENIPVMQLPAIQFLATLVAARQPTRILEVGTAIGYSTIWLALAAPRARITTMELDPDRVTRALNNLEQAGVRDRVEVIEGDARDGLPDHYTFDLIFLDAAKGQYRTYFDLYFPRLKEQGILVCDNVLFRGMVAEDEPPSGRYRQLVEKLKAFNAYLSRHPQLDVSFIPVGDGLAVGVKRGETDEETGTAGNGS
ncbi:MAG: O-methyltransferase [Bacillaceae bacterium]|nr:O-methyltransferase [Bacillaceae bacterium]